MDMRLAINLIETAAPAWIHQDMYHGTARDDHAFDAARVAYFTPDRDEAVEHAYMDAGIEDGQPVLIRARLRVNNPALIDTRLMQDLHFAATELARLKAEGYDCAIGAHEDEICVFSAQSVEIIELIELPDHLAEGAPHLIVERSEQTSYGRVLIDPSPREVQALFQRLAAAESGSSWGPKLRILRENNHYYAWDAYAAQHHDVARALGVGQGEHPAECSECDSHWAESCGFRIQKMHDGDWTGVVIVHGQKDFGYEHNDAGELVAPDY